MTKISLSVLDKYAQQLNAKQLKLLKEKKCVTSINEDKAQQDIPVSKNYECSISNNDIIYAVGMKPEEFIIELDQNYPSLDDVTAYIRDENVTFTMGEDDYNEFLDAISDYDLTDEDFKITIKNSYRPNTL